MYQQSHVILYYIYIYHQSSNGFSPSSSCILSLKQQLPVLPLFLPLATPMLLSKLRLVPVLVLLPRFVKTTVLKWLYPLVAVPKSSQLPIFSTPSARFVLAKSRMLYKPLKPFPLSTITTSLPKQYAMLSSQLG